MSLSQCLLFFSSNCLCSESFTIPADIGSLVCLHFLIICFMGLEVLISGLLISVVRCWRNPLNSCVKPDPSSLRIPTDIIYWFMILLFCSYIWKNFQSHDTLLYVSLLRWFIQNMWWLGVWMILICGHRKSRMGLTPAHFVGWLKTKLLLFQVVVASYLLHVCWLPGFTGVWGKDMWAMLILG